MDVIYASNPKGGLVTINKFDFDPKKHLVEGEKPAPKKRGRPRKKPLTEASDGNC
jgi:hypothetical protein